MQCEVRCLRSEDNQLIETLIRNDTKLRCFHYLMITTLSDFAKCVELAKELDFALGGLHVSPSTGRVFSGEVERRVAPKVMRVLVTLAKNAGRTLNREELIEACWDGRIVTDDAIARVVAQVRALAHAVDPAAFTLETVPKVGFRIISGTSAPIPGLPTRRPSEIRLAVLAFDNLSDESKSGHIAGGIADEILHILAQRTGLIVMGRSTSFRFHGAEKAAGAVGRQLDVTHVLDGSIRHADSRIRVSVQLVSCTTETTIWSQLFENDLTEIFTLQEQVAASVAAALSHAISSRPSTLPVDARAYDLYLRSRTSVERWLGGGDADMLTRAVALAPDFSAAWASLALTRAVQWRAMDAGTATKVAREEAIQAAHKALALDAHVSAAYIAKALLQPRCGAYEEEDAAIERAVACAERDPWTLFHAAQLAETKGRLNEALAFSQRAHDIEPYWPQGLVQLASILEDVGQTNRSEDLFDDIRAEWPQLDYVAITDLFRSARGRRWERVERIIESIEKQGPFGERTNAALRRVNELRLEDPEDALAKLRRERRRIAETGTMSLNIALLCRDGFADEAFDLVERASFEHLFEPEGRFVKWDQGAVGLFFANGKEMRSDPRFVRLCGKLGLARYWLDSGRWPDCVHETAGNYDFKAECRRIVN